jgi:hypothetical protein
MIASSMWGLNSKRYTVMFVGKSLFQLQMSLPGATTESSNPEVLVNTTP